MGAAPDAAGPFLCRDCGATGPDRPGRCPVCASPRLLAHPELLALAIAHLDCDAFYAGVEKRDRPELRDRPVIVGGGRRGVVTTCCYIARTFGVRSAMPMFKALRACPEAVVVRPDFEKYRRESARIFGLVRELTPLVQPLSLDEAWMDLSGTERLNRGAPAQSLARLQGRIERETGLTVSIGLAPNKMLAKIASDLDKPRGFSVIGAAEARRFLAPLSPARLPGVGPAQLARLEALGLATLERLAGLDETAARARLGPQGPRLSAMARGEDARAVDPASERKSISAETTFGEDLAGREALEALLWPLCEKVARRIRREGEAGRVVVLKLKDARFRVLTRRRTLAVPTQTARTLFAEARTLLHPLLAAEPGPFRLVGVGLTDLGPADAEGVLFAEPEMRARGAESAMDALERRFGAGALRRGRGLLAAAEREGAPGED